MSELFAALACAVALFVIFLAQNTLFLTTNALIYVYELLTALQLYATLCLWYVSLRLLLGRRQKQCPHLFVAVFFPVVLYSTAVLADISVNAITIVTSCVCAVLVFASVVCIIRAVTQKTVPAHSPFSARETEVVSLILQGRTTQETADALCISVATVKTHLQHIYEKSGVRNRAELARYMGGGRSSP